MSIPSASPLHQSNLSRSFDPLKAKAKARLRFEVEAAGLPQKALAIGLRTSDALLSRILAEHCPDDLPAYKIPAVVHELGPGYMEWLALQCGGVYHHGEVAQAHQESVSVLVGLLARHSGTTVQQLIQGISDSKWDASERQADLPGLRQLKAVVDALISEAEAQ